MGAVRMMHRQAPPQSFLASRVQAADLRTAFVGGKFHQSGYIHDGHPHGEMHAFIGPGGPTTTLAAPYGYGQDEDKYEGPTFAHVPTVVRPVPLGGADQYHVASDLPLSTKCTLKEKYEPCSVDHRTGYDRYGNLDYAEYTQRPGYYVPAGFGGHPGGGYGGGYGVPHGWGYGYGHHGAPGLYGAGFNNPGLYGGHPGFGWAAPPAGDRK